MRQRRKFLISLGVLAIALMATGLGLAGGAKQGAKGDTLVFGAAADPTILDPSLASDGETFRVTDQIFEGLTRLRPGTLITEPGLATSWKASKDAKTFTFNLRRGVKFHDGTPFDAKAACYNFDRWYNFPAPLQSASASYYYNTVFVGFKRPGKDSAGPKDALYASCRTVGNSRIVVKLKRSFGPFIGVIGLDSFAMQSPTALKRYGADKGRLDGEGVFHTEGTYGTEHPTGTGAYKFKSWELGNRLVLERNDAYWGRKANIKTLILRPISNNAARVQALQTGEIQGYDLVEPQDIPTIKKNKNLKILSRPPFNVGYVTINQKVKPFDNVLVRQAVAHGLDRAGVVKSFYAGRGVVAHEFMPPSLLGYAKDVKKYDYNPAKAKALLQKAGVQMPLKVDFWYPTDISRPYMPDPQRNFQAFAASLNKSGFEVVPHSAPWRPDYVGRVSAGTAGALNLIGWTGDYGDADNFIGTFFRTEQGQWGFKNPAIFRLLNRGLAEPNPATRIKLYQQANRMIMRFLPGVPYVHTSPALAFHKSVVGYKPSPVSLEPFSIVRIR
ncbi:MAG: ABC transporter substrate-binding protein [Gaiellaceae bacterium]